MRASALRRWAGSALALTVALSAVTTPASAAGFWHGGGGWGGWHGGGWGGGWRGGWRGGYYGGWYGWGPAFGFLGGALVGSAIASYPYYGYYGYPYGSYGYPYNGASYPYYGNGGGHCVGYQVTYDQRGHVIGRHPVNIC